MKRGMKNVINTLSSHLIDDADTVKGVFDEFKTEVPQRQARNAARIFSNEELDLLKTDYGSAIDTIKSKKR